MTIIDPYLKLQGVADALATSLSSIDGLTVYAYDPVGTEMVGPAAGIGDHQLRRTDIEEAEQQQGMVDWTITWEVLLYIPLDDAALAFSNLRRFAGAMTALIDADHQLDGEVQESKVIAFESARNAPDEPRAQLIGTFAVRQKFLMPDIRL